MNRFALTASVALFASLVPSAWSQSMPERLSFQGRITDATGNPVNAPTDLTFRLYDAESGGSAIWTESKPAVPVSGGLYGVTLGGSGWGTLDFGSQYWLSVQAGTDGEMAPRYSLSTSPYAMYANKAKDADTLDGQHAGDFADASHVHDAADIASGILPVSVGGTGQGASLTTYGIVYGASGSAMASTAAGTTGQVLTATTGSAPTWQQPILSPIKSGLSSSSYDIPRDTTKVWTSGPVLTITPSRSGTLHITGTANFLIIGGTYKWGIYISSSNTQPTNLTNYYDSRICYLYNGSQSILVPTHIDCICDVSSGITYYIWMGANSDYSVSYDSRFSAPRITATLHSSTGL